MSTTGIDAISYYVPDLYVSMDNLAEARGIEAEKLKRGLGLQKMAVPNVGEDAATFAANALINLIEQEHISPSDIGRVYLGTESAIDGSKPTATYAVEIVENALANSFGDRSFKHCDILDMTFACVGAVDAMHNSIDWVKQDANRKAIVIASDLSKYDINSTGEYTQGAGAVAVLISHNPSLIEINDVWGIASKSEGDFFKPRRSYKKTELLKAVFKELKLDTSEDHVKDFMTTIDSEFWSDNSEIVEVFKEEPVFDGQFSNACYSDRITEALKHFHKQKATSFLEDWNQIIFHLPYAFHGRRILFDNWLQWLKDAGRYDQLENQIGTLEGSEKKDWLKKAYKSELYRQFVDTKIASGELASSEIGNMYTASIFMSLLSFLSESYRNSEDLNGTSVGFIAYGSGSKSKVFEGKIVSGWETKLAPVRLFENLQNRKSIDVSTYEKIHKAEIESPILNGSKISLDYVETEKTNYGLRRYSVK